MSEWGIPISQAVPEKPLSEGTKTGGGSGDSAFSRILSEKMSDSHPASYEAILEAFGLGSSKPLETQVISAEGLEIQPAAITESQEIRSSGRGYELLNEVNRGALQMENMIEMATSGRRFSPPELLALQAGVHQIALEIDLTGKVFEQLNTGTKTLLQTNFA